MPFYKGIWMKAAISIAITIPTAFVAIINSFILSSFTACLSLYITAIQHKACQQKRKYKNIFNFKYLKRKEQKKPSGNTFLFKFTVSSWNKSAILNETSTGHLQI